MIDDRDMDDYLDIDAVDGFDPPPAIEQQIVAVEEAMVELRRLVAITHAEHAHVLHQHEALAARLDRLEQRWTRGRAP